ncbi:MAG: hypothetical protein EPO39_13455 [Candidatus Manganitrophaceae bacterium]|nr:MAG: hypothetical protein EPO39_13455 [Candidatus Manganitrophaceae bacterium]
MNGPVLEPSLDFPALLYKLLPGIYRDKDARGELQRFLEIASLPLEELEVSIAQLYEDLFLENGRAPFIPLIGALIGVEIDPTLPERVQRTEVEEAFAFYRSKGLHDPIGQFAERVTGWRAALIDFSRKVAQVPFVPDLNPVIPYRNQSVGENPPASGNFFFRADQALQPLFDRRTGRPITRQAMAGRESEYAGIEGRFAMRDRGVDLFLPDPTPRFIPLAADLTDFANPKMPNGIALILLPNQVAIDPELGRFKIVPPIPLAGNLRVDFHVLVPASVAVQTFDLRDPMQIDRLNRSDDAAPHTLDIRRPRRPTDRIGRYHFDNLGFFFTLGRRMSNQRPNILPPGSQSGHFSFDGRLLGVGDTAGVSIQLQDGIDGSPLTRQKLDAEVKEFCGTTRGFTLRVNGIDLCSPDFQPAATPRAADLSDFANPKTPSGAAMTLASTEVAIDPQLGRFKLDPTGLGIAAEQIRVDYLLAPVQNHRGTAPAALSETVHDIFGFDPQRKMIVLRDGEDGMPISVKRRLGSAPADFHGRRRGWTVYRNGVDVSGVLLQAEEKDLEDPTTPVTPGRLAVDVDRGRFKFPAGFLSPADLLAVDYSDEDAAGEEQLLASFLQRSPKLLPAGVVPVPIDTRVPHVDPSVLE